MWEAELRADEAQRQREESDSDNGAQPSVAGAFPARAGIPFDVALG